MTKPKLVEPADRVAQIGPGRHRIDCDGLHYQDLNRILRELAATGGTHFELRRVTGQRYLGTDLPPVTIDIHGTPGNDLGSFMNGPKITVYGNGEDGVGNTMNDGEIVIHGHCGDIAGIAMRGGSLFIRDGAGYRVGIHMKEYQDKVPVLVVGGSAHDFLGEYMAGGILVVLGRAGDGTLPANYIGTGMHGGVIYLRAKVEDYQLGKEASRLPMEESDRAIVERYVSEYARHFSHNARELLDGEFTKLRPVSHRPYGKLYAY